MGYRTSTLASSLVHASGRDELESLGRLAREVREHTTPTPI